MHVRLIGDSKMSLRVSVSVHGCVSRLCGPVMDWRSVRGVPRLSPHDRWDRLQTPPPVTLKLDQTDVENGWMDSLWVWLTCYYSKTQGSVTFVKVLFLWTQYR